MSAYHLRGVALPESEPVELWVENGVISTEPVADAETLCTRGWIIPGLVDAHCHVGLGPKGPVELAEALNQAETERDAGVLLIRNAGSPIDTRSFDENENVPRIIRAGRHLARPKRYIPMLGLELEDESMLPDAVAQQAALGDGWVKLVGDWIDRGTGDLVPLWSDGVLTQAISVAHAAGARVTAHVFGEDALAGLINAGIDCLEHGTGLTEGAIEQMVAHGTSLVPTLINIENFPSIAEGASRYPRYAAHMLDLHARVGSTVRAAIDAGIPIFAGTDAGGGIAHGRIVDEVLSLRAAGMSAHDALGAACWDARAWLGQRNLQHGASADLLVYDVDPRTDLAALRRPMHTLLRGKRHG
ncbi:MAG: amidohydrolase family protein [Mycobacteriaceae bacterium]